MSLRIALCLMLLPALALATEKHPRPEPPNPVLQDVVIESHPAAESQAGAEAGAASQSESSSQANPVVNAGSAVTLEGERAVRAVFGGVNSYASDALSVCHERTGIKNGGLFAWGGKVGINDLCMKCTLLIQSGRPDACVALIEIETDLVFFAPEPSLEAECAERESRREAVCQEK